MNEGLKMNVDISQTRPVVCDECGGIYFQEVLHIRRYQALLPVQVRLPTFLFQSSSVPIVIT
jgi:hypothetical protein